jgi:hypothetical protein
MLTVQLNPEKEEALREEATRRGVSAQTYARTLVEEHLPATRPSPCEATAAPARRPTPF